MYRTIPELLADAAGRSPDRSWLRTDDVELTFAEAAGVVGRAGAALEAEGIAHGELVMLTARTDAQYLLSWLAVTALGAIAVPVNPASTPTELAALIEQVSPRLVITDVDQAAGVQAAMSTCDAPAARVMDVAGLIGTLTSDRSGAMPVPTASVTPDDIAVLIATSGTTGRSKLVMQTHRAYAMAGEGFPYWMELTGEDRMMTSLPLFHVNAPAYSVLGSLACGAGLVLLPRFSASGFIDAARMHGATEFNAIGAMLEILMRQPERDDDADNPLRLCYTGPAPDRERHLEIERRFGIRIVCGYALSESPYGLIWPRGSRLYGTLGKERQHPTMGVVNHARVVDDNGADVRVGEAGELMLRNPSVTPGYWGMPEETSAAITPDGWLRTGDLVTSDDEGVYTFVARKKEVLRRRGENLSPAEVEQAIAAYPGVVECAVVGVPSELSEEEIKAFVVLDGEPDAVDFAAIRAFVAERLSPFKVPRFWQRLDTLPRTPTQRVARHRLPSGHPDDEYDSDEP